MNDAEFVSKDKLVNRISHQLRSRGEGGLSAATIANRLKVRDVESVKERLEFMVSRNVAAKKDAGTVYNGLPVVLYRWVS